MLKFISLFLTLIIVTFVIGCIPDVLDISDEEAQSITIHPQGNYFLSDIAIRKIGSIEGSTLNFEGPNYADPDGITSTTKYPVPQGKYYVFLRYFNRNSGVSGWWKTTGDKLVNVGSKEHKTVTYGFSGGRVSEIE